MPVKRPKKEWADPNREGQAKGKEAERFCSKCGNTVQKTRILKSLNLCEYCINELKEKRDGITSCRGCGKIEPLEIKEHNGYCTQCICSACGKPDPQYVRKTGLCFQCALTLGDFCRSCGKEASAQVHKNKGFCDECVATGRNKTLGRHRRSTGYQGKRVDGRGTKPTSPSVDQRQTVMGKPEVKRTPSESKGDRPFTQGRKPFPAKSGIQRRTFMQKPGTRSVSNESRSDMPISQSEKPFLAKPKSEGHTSFPKPGLKSSAHASKSDMPGSRWKKPLLSKSRDQRETSLPTRNQNESPFQKPVAKSAPSKSKRATGGYQGEKSLFPKTDEPRQPFGKPGLRKPSRDSSKSSKPMGAHSKPFAAKPGVNKGFKKAPSRGRV
jgi:hypothetical protein